MADKLIKCPLCSRLTQFDYLYKFIEHLYEKHDDAMSLEVDKATAEWLDEGLARRKQRDADLSAIQAKLVQ